MSNENPLAPATFESAFAQRKKLDGVAMGFQVFDPGGNKWMRTESLGEACREILAHTNLWENSGDWRICRLSILANAGDEAFGPLTDAERKGVEDFFTQPQVARPVPQTAPRGWTPRPEAAKVEPLPVKSAGLE